MENKKAKEEEEGEGKMPTSDEQQGNIKQSQHLTPLSTYMASERTKLMHRQYMASPKGSLWAAKMVAKLIYGEHTTWEQLRKVCSCMPLLQG
jgi:hypothetical protein